jgi:hypothetical protein
MSKYGIGNDFRLAQRRTDRYIIISGPMLLAVVSLQHALLVPGNDQP